MNRPVDAPDHELPPPSFAFSDRALARLLVRPVLRFMRRDTAGGIVMLAAALLAIVWANSPASGLYFGIFDARIELAFGDFRFHHLSELTVREWVNDALMVLFFFVVGLEIKRELVVGELNTLRRAALPAIAALGGMLVPAAIYLAFNAGLPTADGWGVPMATDIAFAVGVLALLGDRVPPAAKLFLLALAIVDDLGAILVIALVYVRDPTFTWLLPAAAGIALVMLMTRLHVRAQSAYVVVSAFIWLCLLESGVHATLDGVLLAFIAPLSSFHSAQSFPRRARLLVDDVEAELPDGVDDLRAIDHHTQVRVTTTMDRLRVLTRESLPPLTRAEVALQPWVAFVVVPLFALANAGVAVSADALLAAPSEPVFLGVAVGLLAGKVTGIVGFTWLAVRLGIGELPRDTSWSHVVGLAMLGAIGFTVALFVASLAFLDPGAQDQAKIGIFAASTLAGVSGYLWLGRVARSRSATTAQPQPASRSEMREIPSARSSSPSA